MATMQHARAARLQQWRDETLAQSGKVAGRSAASTCRTTTGDLAMASTRALAMQSRQQCIACICYYTSAACPAKMPFLLLSLALPHRRAEGSTNLLKVQHLLHEEW
jgi:hypothetical protein